MPINLPKYYEDPYYQSTQKQLSTLGTGLISGEVPDYYKPLGEIGGETFETMLGGIRSDITKGVTEDIARRGGRGGLATDVISRTIGGITPQLRWQEMLRGLGERKSLLGLGTDVLSGTRAAGLTAGAGRRGFDLAQAQLGIGQQQFQEQLGWSKEQFSKSLEEERSQFEQSLKLQRDNMEISQEQFDKELALKDKELNMRAQMWEEEKTAQEEAAEGQMWGDIIGSTLDVAGTILGGPMGGKLGKILGGLF